MDLITQAINGSQSSLKEFQDWGLTVNPEQAVGTFLKALLRYKSPSQPNIREFKLGIMGHARTQGLATLSKLILLRYVVVPDQILQKTKNLTEVLLEFLEDKTPSPLHNYTMLVVEILSIRKLNEVGRKRKNCKGFTGLTNILHNLLNLISRFSSIQARLMINLIPIIIYSIESDPSLSRSLQKLVSSFKTFSVIKQNEYIKLMLAEQYTFIDNLPPATKKILSSYTTSKAFMILIQKMRNNKPLSDKENKNVTSMDTVFSEIPPTRYVLTVYRGIKHDLNLDIKTYISTSYSSWVARSFSLKGGKVLRIKIAKGSKVLPIENVSGYDEEKEILLSRKGKFRLISHMNRVAGGIDYDLIYGP